MHRCEEQRDTDDLFYVLTRTVGPKADGSGKPEGRFQVDSNQQPRVIDQHIDLTPGRRVSAGAAWLSSRCDQLIHVGHIALRVKRLDK